MKHNKQELRKPSINDAFLPLTLYFIGFLLVRIFIFDTDEVGAELVFGALFSAVLFVLAFDYPGFLRHFIATGSFRKNNK